MTEPLNILVVEDNKDHQDAAREQLHEHKLTIAENAHDASELLVGGLYKRYKGVQRHMIASGRYDAYKGLESYMIEKGNFDVLLTDGKLPIAVGPYNGLAYPLDYENKTFDFGYILAFIAGMEGVRYIGILTDANHHNDPTATLSRLLRNGRVSGSSSHRDERPVLKVGEGVFRYSEDVGFVKLDGEFVHNIASKSELRDGVRYSEATYVRLDGSRFTGDDAYGLAKQGSDRVAAKDGALIYYKNWKGLLDKLLER